MYEIKKDKWGIRYGKVCIECPDCKNFLRIDHIVAEDGTVSPSVVCPLEPCKFHKFVKLEGWNQVAVCKCCNGKARYENDKFYCWKSGKECEIEYRRSSNAG